VGEGDRGASIAKRRAKARALQNASHTRDTGVHPGTRAVPWRYGESRRGRPAHSHLGNKNAGFWSRRKREGRRFAALTQPRPIWSATRFTRIHPSFSLPTVPSKGIMRAPTASSRLPNHLHLLSTMPTTASAGKYPLMGNDPRQTTLPIHKTTSHQASFPPYPPTQGPPPRPFTSASLAEDGGVIGHDPLGHVVPHLKKTLGS
jgi:hypothetical protein